MGKKSTPKMGSKASKSTAEGSHTNAKLNATWNHEAHIKYRLSDKEFVTRGWTKLPEDVVIEKMKIYKALSAKPHMLLFKRRRHTERKYYPDETLAAVFKANGTGNIYYPSGKIAIHFKNNTYIILSSGGKDPLTGFIRAQVITALFDTLGNGVVYDNEGTVVINYTQRRGVFEGTQNGISMKWTWPVKIKEDESFSVPNCQKSEYLEESMMVVNDYGDMPNQSTATAEPAKLPSQGASVEQSVGTLGSESEDKRQKRKGKSKPLLVIQESPPKPYEVANNSIVSFKPTENDHENNNIVTQMESCSKSMADSEDATESLPESTLSLAMDFPTFFKAIAAIKKKNNNHPVCAPIKPILRRLNQFMSLRILDQANVSLTFSACGQIFRLELGVVIDPTEIVKIKRVVMNDAISTDGVLNYFEQFPKKSMEKVLDRLTRQRDWSSERLRERQRIATRCGGFV